VLRARSSRHATAETRRARSAFQVLRAPGPQATIVHSSVTADAARTSSDRSRSDHQHRFPRPSVRWGGRGPPRVRTPAQNATPRLLAWADKIQPATPHQLHPPAPTIRCCFPLVIHPTKRPAFFFSSSKKKPT
jgi:hypothetical protein